MSQDWCFLDAPWRTESANDMRSTSCSLTWWYSVQRCILILQELNWRPGDNPEVTMAIGRYTTTRMRQITWVVITYNIVFNVPSRFPSDINPLSRGSHHLSKWNNLDHKSYVQSYLGWYVDHQSWVTYLGWQRVLLPFNPCSFQLWLVSIWCTSCPARSNCHHPLSYPDPYYSIIHWHNSITNSSNKGSVPHAHYGLHAVLVRY